jgi:prepilin signal peptidase PulO-like enzyme (type II secretory pathway)
VMGLYLGWLGWTDLLPVAGPLRLVFYALMLGCVLGVVFGLGVQVATKRRGAFPFGPALALGCYVVVLFAFDLSA